MHLHHLGIAVTDLEQAAAFYAQLGFYPEQGPLYLKSRGVTVLFIRNDAGTILELVEKPARDASPYHLAYEVDSELPAELEALTAGQWGEVAELSITNVFFPGPGGERVELVKVNK